MAIKSFNNFKNLCWGIGLILLACFLGFRFVDNATLPPDASNGSSRHVRLTNLEPKLAIETILHIYYIYETEDQPFGRMLEVSRFDIDTQNKIRLGTLDYARVQEKRPIAPVRRYLYDLLYEGGRQAVRPGSFDSIAKWQGYQAYLFLATVFSVFMGLRMIIRGVKKAELASRNASFLLEQFPELEGDLQQLRERALYHDTENGIYVYSDYLISYHLLTLVDLRQVSLIKGDRVKDKKAFPFFPYYYRLWVYGEDKTREQGRFVFPLSDEDGKDGLFKLRAYLLTTYPDLAEQDFDKITEQ